MKKLLKSICFVLAAILLIGAAGCQGDAQKEPSAPSDASVTQAPDTTGFSSIEAGTSAKSEAGKDTIRIALQRNITDLSGSSGGNATYGVVYSIFDTLVRFEAETMDLIPCLATSWEQVDDTTWRFVLREGVTFTNGEAFNADSAAYSINYLANPDFNYQNYKQWSKSWPPKAEVESPNSILVRTPVPNLAVPKLLTRFAMLPMEASASEEFWTAPIGTGPYKVAVWEAGISLTLDANEDYWAGAPAIKHQVYDFVKDGAARSALIETGEYDFVCEVPLNYTLKLLENNTTPMEIVKTNHTGAWVLYFNGKSDNSFVQNPDFRKAMLYAIDHKGICEYVLGNIVASPKGIGPMYLKGSYDAGGYPDQDVAKAQELAAACGYNGEEIILMYSDGTFNSDDEVLEVVISQLADAGFNVKLESVDSATWGKYKATSEYDIGLNFFGGPYIGDTEQNYTQGLGGCFIAIDEADVLLNEIFSAGITEERRIECLTEIMRISWEYVPYLWASESCGMWAVNPNLKGYEVFQNNQVSFNNAYFE